MSEFTLSPGNRILRKDLHAEWGGRQQGGISPSRSTSNIFIFWSPALGEKHGYYDEFRSDGRFYYTGAGQSGDQRMRDANLALLHHREQGRRVHLFAGAGGEVEYIGELELDDREPYYETEAPETDAGPLRRVYVFRFRLMSGSLGGRGLVLRRRSAILSLKFRSRTGGRKSSSSDLRAKSMRLSGENRSWWSRSSSSFAPMDMT